MILWCLQKYFVFNQHKLCDFSTEIFTFASATKVFVSFLLNM